MMRLAAAFPQANVRDTTVALYIGKLEGLDESVVVKVVEGAIENASRFPTLAELRESCLHEIQRRRDLDDTPQLGESRGIPMPPYVKAQVQELKKKMAVRSQELEPS